MKRIKKERMMVKSKEKEIKMKIMIKKRTRMKEMKTNIKIRSSVKNKKSKKKKFLIPKRMKKWRSLRIYLSPLVNPPLVIL